LECENNPGPGTGPTPVPVHPLWTGGPGYS